MAEYFTGISLIHPENRLASADRAVSNHSGRIQPSTSPCQLDTWQLRLQVKECSRAASSIADADPVRFPTTLDALLEVPRPGREAFIFGKYQGFELGLESQISIREVREKPSPWIRSEPDQKMQKSFTITRKLQTTIHVECGFRVLMVAQNAQEHRFFGPGSHQSNLLGRRWTIQVQSDSGERTCVRIKLPDLLTEEILDISDYAGYRLIAQRRPLQRVLKSLVTTPVKQDSVDRHGRPIQIPPSTEAVFEYLYDDGFRPSVEAKNSSLASEPFALPSGRYKADVSRLPVEPLCQPPRSISLRLYPSLAVKVEYGSQMLSLIPCIDGTYRTVSAGPSDFAKEIIFHPKTNTLVLRPAEKRQGNVVQGGGGGPLGMSRPNSFRRTSVIQVKTEDRLG
jgi:hypothetical protein